METKIKINRLNTEFDFSLVPSWYAICTNGNCPLKQDCLRYLAGSNAPESLETALCVMPHMANDGHCQLFDKKNVVVMAAGFTTLYDQVLKKDYTSMRKAITRYLHGAKTDRIESRPIPRRCPPDKRRQRRLFFCLHAE